MGASIAYHLAERGVEDIVLVERDTPGAGSTSKAAGGVRCQFSDEVNIALAARGLEVLRTFEDGFGVDIAPVRHRDASLLDSDAPAGDAAATCPSSTRASPPRPSPPMSPCSRGWAWIRGCSPSPRWPNSPPTSTPKDSWPELSTPVTAIAPPRPSCPATSPPLETAGCVWSRTAR